MTLCLSVSLSQYVHLALTLTHIVLQLKIFVNSATLTASIYNKSVRLLTMECSLISGVSSEKKVGSSHKGARKGGCSSSRRMMLAPNVCQWTKGRIRHWPVAQTYRPCQLPTTSGVARQTICVWLAEVQCPEGPCLWSLLTREATPASFPQRVKLE